MDHEYYKNLADKIYSQLVDEARLNGIDDDFSDKEIAEFNHKLNSDDNIPNGQKAELSHYLGEKLRNIEI